MDMKPVVGTPGSRFLAVVLQGEELLPLIQVFELRGKLGRGGGQDTRGSAESAVLSPAQMGLEPLRHR